MMLWLCDLRPLFSHRSNEPFAVEGSSVILVSLTLLVQVREG